MARQKPQKQIRISGLVKAARRTREQLAAGIPPAEAEAFRRQVRAVVAQVEAICREHDVRPESLPTPSYRAYCYLESLDLDDLPLRPEAAPQRPPEIRISGVVAAQNQLHARFGAWAADARPDSAPLSAADDAVQGFVRQLETHVQQIEALARQAGSHPAYLPPPSRRAYQWLKFLSEPTTLMTHLETLRTLASEFRHPRCRTQPAKSKRAVVRVALANTAHLYRARAADGELEVKVNEGFLGAPPRVLRALVCAVLTQGHADYQEIVKAYSVGEDFLEVTLAVEMTTSEADAVTQGQCFDLAEIFDRVNAAHFEGQLERPGLTWNRMITGARMGYYDPLRDTVMLSVTLDTPATPDFVVDFVMYHELLHRQLGIHVAGGRRYAHTSAFRDAERRFPRYAEAQAHLRQLAADGRPPA